MSTTFMTGSDWQGSSGPELYYRVHIDDVWPEGSGASKDDLADGDHPAFAIGPKAERPLNPCGFVVSYDSTTGFVVLNMARGFIASAYVANITAYSGGDASAWAATLEKHVPVWIDDSDDLPAGVTLSRSDLNDADAHNPMFGYTWPEQDEWDDSDVGGGNSDPFPKSFTGNDATYVLTVDVMLMPDNFYFAPA